MTRGRMILLGVDDKIYKTMEFNGDMYTQGHGDEIIREFEDGHLQDIDSFSSYVRRFARNKFHYIERRNELIKSTTAEENRIFDVRENWTDFLYIFNESGKEYTLLTNDGEISLGKEQMAVVYFSTLKMIKDKEQSQKGNPTFLISKKEFVSILKRIQETNELVDDIDKRLRKFKDDQIRDFCSGAGLVISNEDCVLRLLTLLTEDKYGYIDYFVYELKYGKEYYEGCITCEDGSFVDLSCAEKLYDYLVEEKK